METLASFWSHDPCDLGQNRHEASAVWATAKPPIVTSLKSSRTKHHPPIMVTENHYVEKTAPSVSCAMWTELSPHLQRNKQLHDTLLQREEELARLQEENQKLRQFLNSSFVKDLEEKAKMLSVNGKRKRNLSSLTPPISKRVCRNLTAEFCSESEPSGTSLDLWVLKTLGLKDKDTIDTMADNNNTTTNQYNSPLEHNTNSCNDYQSPITANMLQTSPNPSENQDRKDSGFDNVSTDFLSPNSSTCYTYSNGQSPNISFTMEKSQPEVYQWPLPFQTTVSYSPMERLHFLPKFCSTPKKANQNSGNAPSPMMNSRPDLAFSMSLSPNHSLKTHSFPHGQAFVRRDNKGRCSFTWVPRDRN